MGCPSCNVGANRDNPEEITSEWLEAFFRDSGKKGIPRYLIWTGGEPFMSFNTLRRGIALGAEQGYHSEILTSGSWCENNPQFLRQLKAAGPFALRISIDPEHQDKVPLSLMVELTRQALEEGIKIGFTLREIPHREKKPEFYIRYLKQQIPLLNDPAHRHSRQFHTLPHITLPFLKPPRSRFNQLWKSPCYQGFKDLVIGPDSQVYPCCGFFSLTFYPRLGFMNPLDYSRESHERKILQSPLLRTLRARGPIYLGTRLGIKEVQALSPGFNTPCDLCLYLFDKYHAQIDQYFPLR